ncbi:S-layer homology domain-containing protein [Pseudoneobacillus sp. C159]
MLNWRKFIVTGALATTLTFSSLSAMAVSFDDVSSNEIAISKVVSLGIVVNNGANFNPEKGLSRQEFAEISSRIMTLGSPKAVKITDVKNNSAVTKAVSAGILTVNSKGQFKPKNAITNADLARGLAFGLGFKKSWSNRPIDHLYFLERKGVLDIDTDLDAVVTREEAAVAIDNYMTVKEGYTTAGGIVVKVMNGDVLVVKTDSGNKSYKIAKNSSIFVDSQAGDAGNLAAGTNVKLNLNKKGEIGFASGNGLEMLDGKLGFAAGALTLNGTAKNWLLNGLVSSLPNSKDVPFTFTEFSNYASKANVTFEGGIYSDTVTDEITVIEPYITSVKSRAFKVEKNKLVFDFSDTALKSQSFSLAEGATIKLVEGETKTDKTLADISALIAAGKDVKGAITAGSDGLALTLEVTATDKK